MPRASLLLPYLGRWGQYRKTRFHQLAERLAKQGFAIHILQAPPMESEETTFRDREIQPHDNIILHNADLSKIIWNKKLINKTLKKGYYGIGVKTQVDRLIKDLSIDILWLYNLPHYSLSKKKDCAIIFDYVDDYVGMLNNECKYLNNRLIKRFEYFFFAELLKRAQVIFSVSYMLQHNVKRMIGEKVPCVILPNGVDINNFRVDLPNAFSPKVILQEPLTVGFIGSFEYFIDFDIIFGAAKKLPEIKFLLIGDGREYNRLLKLKKDEKLSNLEFTGLVGNEEMPRYISKMDICLNIFKKISLAQAASPLKLFEYLAMGKPVITTTLEEVKIIDKDFLFYADTVEELVVQIKWIFDHYPAAVEKTLKAKSLIETKYNWDSIAKEFINSIETYIL